MIRILKRGLDLARSHQYKLQREIVTRREKKRYGSGELLTLDQGNDRIGDRLESQTPSLIGKIGTTELNCLKISTEDHSSPSRGKWDPMKKTDGRYFGGIYPDTPQIFEKFSEIYADALKSIDLLGVWFTLGEHRTVKRYCDSAELVGGIQFLEPYFFANPWSARLEHKKVLIVSPFESTLKFQIDNNREFIWANPKVLPEFQTKTLRIPQNAGVEKPAYPDWIEAFENIKGQVAGIDFDVAIIGAGAWSIPLGAYIKSELGKIAIHLGGATQILFGIKGSRWDHNPRFTRFYNQYWTRIHEADKPDMDKVRNIPKKDQYW